MYSQNNGPLVMVQLTDIQFLGIKLVGENGLRNYEF